MDRIIQYLLDKFSKKRDEREGSPRNTGLELKFPVVNKNGLPINPKTLQDLFHGLSDFGWQGIVDQQGGMTVAVEKKFNGKRDWFGTETGICKLEYSPGYESDLFTLQKKFEGFLEELSPLSMRYGFQLLGLGCHPLGEPSDELIIKKGRNLFWDDVFSSQRLKVFTITASSQAHIDLNPDELIEAINVFNGMAGIQIALNGNSAVWCGKAEKKLRSINEQAWDWWLPGNKRVGMVQKRYGSLEEYVEYLLSLRPIYIERKGFCLGIHHYRDFGRYFLRGSDAYGIDNKKNKVHVTPELADFDLHFTFCWNSARLSEYMTLENRVNCQQPPGETMCIAALSLGIMENLEQASHFIKPFDWKELMGLREKAIKQGMKARIRSIPAHDLCVVMLDIAQRGLKKRQKGEEMFLQPLYQRLIDRANPAEMEVKRWKKLSVPEFIKSYSIITDGT